MGTAGDIAHFLTRTSNGETPEGFPVSAMGRNTGRLQMGERMIYPLSKTEHMTGGASKTTTVSPVEQTIKQAKSMIKRGRSGSISHSSGRPAKRRKRSSSTRNRKKRSKSRKRKGRGTKRVGKKRANKHRRKKRATRKKKRKGSTHKGGKRGRKKRGKRSRDAFDN